MPMYPNNSRDNSSIIKAWYVHAIQLPGSVERLLVFLRERQRISEEDQQILFGATPQSFLRLQAMRAPRSEYFVEDAKRIAEVCDLTNVRGFVSEMVLARNLIINQQDTSNKSYYEAALDDRNDLDNLEEE